MGKFPKCNKSGCNIFVKKEGEMESGMSQCLLFGSTFGLHFSIVNGQTGVYWETWSPLTAITELRRLRS